MANEKNPSKANDDKEKNQHRKKQMTTENLSTMSSSRPGIETMEQTDVGVATKLEDSYKRLAEAENILKAATASMEESHSVDNLQIASHNEIQSKIVKGK